MDATYMLRFRGLCSPSTGPTQQGALSRRLPLARPGRLRFCRTRAAGDESKGGREPWDVGRFVRTILYFNPLPTPAQFIEGLASQPLAAVRALTGSSTEERKSAVMTLIPPVPGAAATTSRGGASATGGVTFVAGASGGVGRRVVELLLKQGRRVRALVRDPERARTAATGAGSLELVAGDLTRPESLPRELGQDVSSLIVCSTAKVRPKEGDTEDRQKYRQGLKYYPSEVVGDKPEAVELGGIRNVLKALDPTRLGLQAGFPIFSPAGQGPVRDWGPLDDVVMGGVSESGFEVRAGAGERGGPAGVFSGAVSTSNSGGFASVRCRNMEPRLDLSSYEGIALRIKGDGLRYKAILRTDTGWDSISYCRSFDTKPGEWQTVKLPFREFKPIFRALSVRDGAPLDPSRIASLQLMLSKFEYDGGLNPHFRTGRFSLPLESVTAYMASPIKPRIIFLSCAAVTRPGRPGLDPESEPLVKLNDDLGGILTYKLAAEEEVRASGVPFVVVRPTALTEEPAGAPLEFEQGDNVRGKISRDDVAQLLVALLEEPCVVDTTFEVRSTIPVAEPWVPPSDATPVSRNWGELLQNADLRRGVTGRTVDGIYMGKEPEPGYHDLIESPAPTEVQGAAV
eukprot:jgi/Botrbrau1/19656/Bobra.0003s0021.2